MERKLSERIIAGLLTLLMITSTVPASVFAEGLDEAVPPAVVEPVASAAEPTALAEPAAEPSAPSEPAPRPADLTMSIRVSFGAAAEGQSIPEAVTVMPYYTTDGINWVAMASVSIGITDGSGSREVKAPAVANSDGTYTAIAAVKAVQLAVEGWNADHKAVVMDEKGVYVAEICNVQTDALAPVEEPTEATEPVEESTEATEPAEEPTEVTEPVEESTEVTEPVEETTEATEVVEETTEATEPAEEPTEVTEPVEESTEVTEPAEESTEATEPVEESTEATEPVEEATEPAEEATEATEPAEEATEATEPAADPTESVDPEADSEGSEVLDEDDFADGSEPNPDELADEPVPADKTLHVKVYFGERTFDESTKHPTEVEVTPYYTTDGVTWVALPAVTIPITDREGRKDITIPALKDNDGNPLKDENGEFVLVTGVKAVQTSIVNWDTTYKPVIESDDGNYSVDINNYKPLVFEAEAKWTALDTGKHVSADDPNHLIVHPLSNNTHSVKLMLNITMDGSSDQMLPTESVRFTVPAAIFQNRDPELGYMAFDNSSIQIGTDATQAPATGNTDFYYYVRTDANGRVFYELTNWRPIAATSVYATITYSYRPTQVAGGYLVSGTFGAEDAVYGGNYYQTAFDVPIVIDTDGDGVPNKEWKENFSLEVHTQIKPLDKFVKEAATDNNDGIFLAWQDNWGPRPADAGDYFYIVWKPTMNRSRQFTQPFTVNISEVDEVTITSTKNKQITWSGDYSAELIGALGSKNTLPVMTVTWPESLCSL